MNIAQRENLMAQVDALNAPYEVEDAARRVVSIAAAGGTPPRDLVTYVQTWMSKQSQQSRYGK